MRVGFAPPGHQHTLVGQIYAGGHSAVDRPSRRQGYWGSASAAGDPVGCTSQVSINATKVPFYRLADQWQLLIMCSGVHLILKRRTPPLDVDQSFVLAPAGLPDCGPRPATLLTGRRGTVCECGLGGRMCLVYSACNHTSAGPVQVKKWCGQ